MVLLLLLLMAVPGPSLASSLVVPDNSPTIQAALDLMPDTVLVRSGTYAEQPTLLMTSTSPVRIVLMGLGPTPPELDGFRILISHEREEILVQRFRFKGLVRLDTGDEVTEWIRFRGCEFEGGYAQTYSDVKDVMAIEFRDCRIHGEFAPYAEHIHIFEGNVADGPVLLRGMLLGGLNVVNNTILAGPSPSRWVPGLEVQSDGIAGVIKGNWIRGFPTAMYVPYSDGVRIQGNRLEDASDYGIRSGSVSYRLTVENNEIMRCGTGILLEAIDAYVIGNVIGHSLYSGIEAFVDSRLVLRNNTIFHCGGSAIRITGFIYDTAIEIDHNIGHGSGLYGLYGAPPGAAVGCNDWFGNAAGAVHPSGPYTTDLGVDPLFCASADDSVHLEASSPLLDAPSCGLIGARGQGCGLSTTAVDAQGSTAAFRLGTIAPQPSSGAIEVRFRLAHAATIELVILDLQGRLISRLADGAWAVGEHSVRWPAGADAGRVAPGMYFARYRYPGGQQSRTLLRLR